MRETVPFEGHVRTIDIPVEAHRQYLASVEKLRRHSALVWAEHCTECAWPVCYSSCSLYTPRGDLKCRRLKQGIQEVAFKVGGRLLTGMMVTFNKWGKLEAEGSILLVRPAQARRIQVLDRILGQIFEVLPVSFDIKTKVIGRWNRFKRRNLLGGEPIAANDHFAIECSVDSPISIQLKLRILSASGSSAYFEESIWLRPGYNLTTIEVARIAKFLDLDQPLRLQIEPALQPPPLNSMLFTRLEFVRFDANWQPQNATAGSGDPDAAVAIPIAIQKLPQVKCVVWDLDNTLWQGTLVELGPEGIRLRPEVTDIIVELDRRGVLQSIASKNNSEEAIAALKRFGLADYFLYPQIHWYPKSQSIKQLGESLNIGLDTFVFIDDEPFEREEVRLAHPSVRTVPTADINSLLRLPEFDLPATQESQRRRLMYREEEQRSVAFSNSTQDFLSFLANCELKLELNDMSAGTMQRVFELTQRTNQLNYRGRQIPRLDLERLLLGGPQRGIVMSCCDKFGDYGIIGFVVFDASCWIIEDFFMSCRVQRKKVEQALMGHLQDLAMGGGRTIRVHYKRSKRNGPALEMLSEMGFQRVEGDEEEAIYIAPAEIDNRDIVELTDNTSSFSSFAMVG